MLLESIPLTASSGMDHAEVTLATLRPADAGTEPGEALDRLLKACWHTYPNETGTRWQFRYEPNVNKLIEERAAQVECEDAKAAVLALAKEKKGDKLVKQQLDKVLPDIQRNAGIETARAFCRVLRPGGRFLTLEEEYMVSEEGALRKPRGQANLKQFLDDQKLVYGADYEAALVLDFGDEGRSGMAEALEQAKEEASEALQVSATFGEPSS